MRGLLKGTTSQRFVFGGIQNCSVLQLSFLKDNKHFES